MSAPQRIGDSFAPAGPPAVPAAGPAPDDALARLGAELLRRADEGQPALAAAWDELMGRWQIAGEPVAVERLREMILHDAGDKYSEPVAPKA